MKTLILAMLALALAGCAATATMTTVPSTGTSDTYYWLHPKQGVVKVDRATNAIVVRR